MNTSGDAAEQIVRLSLEGVEVAAKVTGNAALEIASLLYAALKNRDKNKTKGRQRLSAMLKSGKELTIFSVKNEDMKRFVTDAKRYGIVYCALRNPKGNPGGECEIMVRAEDVAKINRIVENLKIATVSNVQEIREQLTTEKSKSEKEQESPAKSDDEILVESMLEKSSQTEVLSSVNPSSAKMENTRLSEPSSRHKTSTDMGEQLRIRSSVRNELKEIQNNQKKESNTHNKNSKHKFNSHKQPFIKKKKRTKEK